MLKIQPKLAIFHCILSFRILSPIKWPNFLYGTVFMKHLHTRISLYRPVLCIIGGPEPFKGLNLDQKKVVVRGEILITAVNFWFLTIKYCIWHIILLQIVPSKSMNAGKSNKGSLGWLMGPYSLPKSPKMVKKQQYFMIYWATESYQPCYDPNFYLAQSVSKLSTLE